MIGNFEGLPIENPGYHHGVPPRLTPALPRIYPDAIRICTNDIAYIGIPHLTDTPTFQPIQLIFHTII